MKRLILVSGLVGLLAVGCGRAPEKNDPVADAPVAEPVAASAVEVEPEAEADSVGVDVTETTEVEVTETVELDPEAEQNRAVRAEVLARIDQMPNLEADDKDRFYVQVDRARGMGKVMTIPFASGETRIGKQSADELGAKLEVAAVQELIDNPTVVFVVLGFADTKGDPARNLAISLERAESALDVLRDRYELLNVMHAVGMGSTELLGSEDLDKNRAVEIWAVVP